MLLLLSFLPSTQETMVYIDEVSIENAKINVIYRINDSLPKRISQNYNSTESIVTLPETTVRIGWSWEYVFDEYDWVVDCEPTERVIWTY